jgi:DNA-binding SARP family transcriptional activator
MGVKMARLRICLLGGFEARLDNIPLALPLPRKAVGLLACLAARRGKGSSRDSLGALLWGGGRPAQARHSVRQALLSTRQALSACGQYSALVAQGNTLALDPTRVDVDVADFERLLDDGAVPALEAATILYRGEFLDGFRVNEPAFDDWAAAERMRLRERARHALSGLLQHHDGSGAVEPAIETAERLLRVDRTQERVHRTLIQLYSRLGRRADALRQYRTCVGMLRTELGVEPAPETVRLYRELLRPRPAPRGPIREA